MTDLSPETVERMVALVRRMAEIDWQIGPEENAIQVQAAAIVADLPEPVDPEYERAEKMLTELWYEENRFAAIVKFAAEQVQRGRTLSTTASDQGRG